jgi:hypothetical protein
MHRLRSTVVLIALCFVAATVSYTSAAAGSQTSNSARVHSEVELKLNSENIGELLNTLDDLWRGNIPYQSGIGDLLVTRYNGDAPVAVRPVILWVLHKYKHPQVGQLLEEAKRTARPGELEVLKCIESDLDPRDPSIGMRVYRVNLEHIDTLTAHELEQITYGLYTYPDKFKYDVKVGDALANRYAVLPKGQEYYHARQWILKVLHQQQHPAFPALLEKLRSSDDPDEQKWAKELESTDTRQEALPYK